MLVCKGKWTHSIDGSEFDCDYEHAGDICCEDCIINGGRFSPATGKLFRGNVKKYRQPYVKPYKGYSSKKLRGE